MSQNVHSDLLLQSPVPIVVVGGNLEVELANDAFLDLSGFARPEVVGTRPPFPWWNKGDSDISSATEDDIEAIYRKGVKKLKRCYVRKDGVPFGVDLTVSPVQG